MDSRLMSLLFLLGRPFSPFYGLLMRLRAELYRRGIFPRQRLSVPVVSVGNLTMGGTGKTPLVRLLVRLLASRWRVAIISRGYGGRAKGAVNLVADGRRIYLPAREAGDEPRWLAESLPGVVVLTGRRRAEVGRAAVARLGSEAIILDDGFQHLALERELDLVLFSARSFLGNGRVCPGGPLREPLAALGRADAFVITGVDQDNRPAAEDFRARLLADYPRKPVFLGSYRAAGLRHSQQEGLLSLDLGRAAPLYGFCGLANPGSFRQTLHENGFQLAGFQYFPDHHPFTAHDLEMLRQAAARSGGATLIASEKDFVKLRPLAPAFPLWVLCVELEMEAGFAEFVLATLGARE